MNFLSSGVFWGAVIVIFGLSLILREVFHINFPLLRVLFGLILIYWGVRVIADGFTNRTRTHQAVLSNDAVTYDGWQHEYNTMFGNSTVDFFKIDSPTEDKRCEVNAIFGQTTIIVNDNIPMKIKMDAAFGQVAAPGKSVAGFGEAVYTTSAYSPDKPAIHLKADAVFGRIAIETRKW